VVDSNERYSLPLFLSWVNFRTPVHHSPLRSKNQLWRLHRRKYFWQRKRCFRSAGICEWLLALSVHPFKKHKTDAPPHNNVHESNRFTYAQNSKIPARDGHSVARRSTQYACYRVETAWSEPAHDFHNVQQLQGGLFAEFFAFQFYGIKPALS